MNLYWLIENLIVIIIVGFTKEIVLVVIKVQGYQKKIVLDTIPLGGYNIVLEALWLRKHNP